MKAQESSKTKMPKTPSTTTSKDHKTGNSKEELPTPIAPHYDTGHQPHRPNGNVEISKGNIGDGFQTDSRPK